MNMINVSGLMYMCNKKVVGSTEMINVLGLQPTGDNYKLLKKEMLQLGATYVKPKRGKTYYELNEMEVRKTIAKESIKNYSFFEGKYDKSYY